MKGLTYVLTALLPVTLWAQKPAVKPAVKPRPYAAIDAKAEQWPDSVTATVEKLGRYVNDHFAAPPDKARAIFIWITNNIQYDIDNMFAINFYEDEAAKIAKPLRTRKGICENYAALFTAICGQVGIPAVVIEGYTRQRGFVDFIPHAWATAYLDGEWWLFDPTWGSGYVENKKFVRQLNEDYYKARPESFIRSHMPFDYLWELLSYPITNQEFYEGKTAGDKTKGSFSYVDSIRAYQALSPIDQEKAEAVRVEKNGLRNGMVFDRLRHLKVDIENARVMAENDRQNRIIDAYNGALRDYNNGIRQFNVFINYRNDQFKPARPDPEIQQMLDSADHQIQAAKSGAEAIMLTTADSRVQQPLEQLKQSIADINTHVKEQQEWLTKYFSKSKLGRRGMFTKVTWFGVPLN